MSEEHESEIGPGEKNTTRRKLIKSGAIGATALSIPGFTAMKGKASPVGKPKKKNSESELSLEREVVETTPTYRIVRTTVDGESTILKVYTAGEKEGVIATLDNYSEPSGSTNGPSVGTSDIANPGWTDKVARYKVIDRSTYENCKDSGYGDHLFKGAAIEFNVLGTVLKNGTVTSILLEIFSQAGLGGTPFLEQAISLLVAFILDQATTGFTVGVADKDGWLDIRYVSVRAARSYDADAFGGTQQLALLPGVHVE